ncbi:DUF4286 family protein [Flavihumibacter stibioxidans]|uniref:DUF4286 domain-containing protein n=1 Tax=Flavihumibacter stibioxidans TaxID=1834163 RepID=A0ABR7M9Y4_9BACT|nr:DUF4286 family protein [Flavihumibacter stibioxidans]MBC6491741.1 hypothetical protein [Flavihumibacter stibioxidans]
MFIYNVTTHVDWSIAEEWLKWMKDEHIPEVTATGCFETGRILRLMEVDETDGPTYAVQYSAASKADYNRYISLYAEGMRKKVFEKWGERTIAFRSLMELVY